MVTEQDVIGYLNERAGEDSALKDSTRKYVKKLKELETLQNIQQEELKSLRLRLKGIEEDLLRTRGAISVVLELAAEEEGLIAPPPQPEQDSTDSNNSDE